MALSASLFRLLNVIVAILLVLGGIVLFVDIGSWNSGILGVFIVIFGLLTFLLEFSIPESIVYNMGFMFSLLGRGIFYVCMGVLCLSWRWFNILVGCFVMLTGLLYIAMHFSGATPSPSMSADPNAEAANMNTGYGSASQYNDPGPSNMHPNMTQTYQNPNDDSYEHAPR
ncbi:COPI associated protein-domain-containing protein [Gamsiella multidivaricata]|uniref:COPI associated protein-domain-containing protein n=1 Tax=Gamsiella multidivaricata TaxID=101098 RepID=UPI00221EE941|nr:COPI associated protein-domain-containing protein [Gamsiella multidivaricata]KAI7828079.1 COPI associated protein-domain-containing protein [Gamsiella multidivaricata]